MNSKLKQALLILLVILLGIVIGFKLDTKQRLNQESNVNITPEIHITKKYLPQSTSLNRLLTIKMSIEKIEKHPLLKMKES